MASFVRFLLRHRAPAFGIIGLSLAVAVYSALSIQVRFQFRDLYDYPANQNLSLFKHDNDLFGDPAGYVVTLIEADDVVRPDVLAYVRSLTDMLEPNPVFKRIRSLTNTTAIRSHGDEVLTGKLMPDLPSSPEELAEIEKYLLGSPLFARRLLSSDAKMTAVLADMRVPAVFATIEEQRAAVEAVQKAVATLPPPAGVHVKVTGAPSVEIGTTDALIGDQLLLLPAVVVVLGLMLFLTFRSLHGILLCMSSVTVALVWTAGLFSQLHRPADLLSSVIPVTMLVYGVVDPVFVLARYRSKLQVGRDKNDVIVETLRELALPCFLTSLTTSIGFAAFATSVSPSVRIFGLTVAVGVLLAFVTTVVVLPLLLSVVNMPAAKSSEAAAGPRVVSFIRRLTRFSMTHPVTNVLVAFVLLAAGVYFGRQQRIDSGYVASLPRGETRSDVRLFEDHLTGVARMVVSLSGPEGSLKRPEVMLAIEQLDHAIERLPLVTHSASIADMVGEAHAAFQGNGESAHVPNSVSLIGQYLSMLDPIDRADLATENYGEGHIGIIMKDRGSLELYRIADAIKRAITASKLEQLGVHAVVTGHMIVSYQELDGVVVELLYGLLIAFGIVILFEWLIFRSWRMALLSVVPNTIPIAVCFLATRAFDIPLRIDTALVSSVCIGGLFNTTIHMMARVLQQVDEGKRNPEQIVREAVIAVGPPSLFSVLVLAFGFAVFALSRFMGLQVLGVLSMVTLGAGFISDMMFTPAFIRLGFNWEAAFRARAQQRDQELQVGELSAVGTASET